jgi:hypothetical protein
LFLTASPADEERRAALDVDDCIKKGGGPLQAQERDAEECPEVGEREHDLHEPAPGDGDVSFSEPGPSHDGGHTNVGTTHASNFKLAALYGIHLAGGRCRSGGRRVQLVFSRSSNGRRSNGRGRSPETAQ